MVPEEAHASMHSSKQITQMKCTAMQSYPSPACMMMMSRGFVFQQKSTPHITSPHPKTNEPIFQPESPPGKEVLEPSASTSHPRFVLLTHHAGGF
jgi:hypothetical protein